MASCVVALSLMHFALGDTPHPILPATADQDSAIHADVNSLATATSPAEGIAQPSNNPVCPGDLNADGQADADDLGILLGAFQNNAGGDLNGDGVTDADDLGILLGAFGSKCEKPGIVILGFEPQSAEPGELVKIVGLNFGDDPKNLCLVSGEVIFEPLQISADGTSIIARLFAVPPGAPPAPMMIGIGEGECVPVTLLLPFQTGGEVLFWIGDQDDPEANFKTGDDLLFTPIEPMSDATGIIHQRFGFFSGGRLFMDLTGVTVPAGAKVDFFFRAWCPLRLPDVNFNTMTFNGPINSGSTLASVLCANAEFEFQNRGFTTFECNTNGAVIEIRYTDCDLNPTAPTAVVRVRR